MESEEGRGTGGGRGWPGLRGLVLPAAWRWFQVADAGAALFARRVVVAIEVVVVAAIVVVVKVRRWWWRTDGARETSFEFI